MLVLRKLNDVIGDVAKLEVRIPVVPEIRYQIRALFFLIFKDKITFGDPLCYKSGLGDPKVGLAGLGLAT